MAGCLLKPLSINVSGINNGFGFFFFFSGIEQIESKLCCSRWRPITASVTHLCFLLSSCVCCRWYYIVVVPVVSAAQNKWETPEDMDIEEVSEGRLDGLYGPTYGSLNKLGSINY